MNTRTSMTLLCVLALAITTWSQQGPSGKDLLGQFSYDDFEKPETCKSCHVDIYYQWDQAMMSKAYTHHWDEIEYFDLAVAHAEKDPELKGAVDGCNGCHTPMAYMAGDVTPPRPSEGSRANESVNCDVCHTIAGTAEDPPYNFSYIPSPGRVKYGGKPGQESPHHDTQYSELFTQPELCGNCHNEQSPFGAWVKSTQIEWAEGPYAEEGVPCQDCHMPKAPGKSARMADSSMVAQHLFHGAHDPGKVASTIELRMHPTEREIPWDGVAELKVQLFNAKTGHKFPTGSVEDRIVWLHVTATDAEGHTYHLRVDEKGFKGEEYTIAADVLAYQDMGIPKGIENFEGVQRDGVPVGDRIYRKPYFDPQGRMTIMQWNTKSFGVDYRLGPRETKIETFTWQPPEDIPVGKVTFHAQLNYRKLIKPVADFLEVPEEESEIIPVNSATTWIEIYE